MNNFIIKLSMITLLFASTSTPVLAQELVSTSDQNQNSTGVAPLTDDEIEELWSDKHLKEIDKRIESLKSYSQSKVTTRAGDVILNTSRYTQENGYYCVPACAQILIEYVTGTKYSQNDLANVMGTNTNPSAGEVGTTPTNAVEVIQSLTQQDYEIGLNSYSNFYSNMVADINANFPVIYFVNYKSLGYYPTDNVGHAVLGNGYGSGDIAWFWDVNAPYQNNYYISASDLSIALNAWGEGVYIF